MATEPVPKVLSRTIEDPQVAKTLDELSAAVGETVNFGTHVMCWCGDPATEAGEGATLTLFAHALELLDAISILLKQSCIDPCKLLLRALLETLWGVEYVFQADTKRRALSFAVCRAHHEIKWLRTLDPDTPDGKRYRTSVEKDSALRAAPPGVSPERLPQLRKDICGLEAPVATQEYAEVEAEYQRLRSSDNKNPRWYSLFGGPKKIEQLADRVQAAGQYELFYRQWSDATHGTDVWKPVVGWSPPGNLWLPRMRDASYARFAAGLALPFGLAIYDAFVMHYMPDRKAELTAWYDGQVRNVCMSV